MIKWNFTKFLVNINGAGAETLRAERYAEKIRE